MLRENQKKAALTWDFQQALASVLGVAPGLIKPSFLAKFRKALDSWPDLPKSKWHEWLEKGEIVASLPLQTHRTASLFLLLMDAVEEQGREKPREEKKYSRRGVPVV